MTMFRTMCTTKKVVVLLLSIKTDRKNLFNTANSRTISSVTEEQLCLWYKYTLLFKYKFTNSLETTRAHFQLCWNVLVETLAVILGPGATLSVINYLGSEIYCSLHGPRQRLKEQIKKKLRMSMRNNTYVPSSSSPTRSDTANAIPNDGTKERINKVITEK